MSAALVDAETGEVIGTELALPDAGMLELANDPGQQIVLACERANAWLQSGIAVPIESIVETKAQAAALAAFAVQKQLGRDAEIAAQEVQRRAERGTGLAIRHGQAHGEIRKRGQREDRASVRDLPTPTDFATPTELNSNSTGIYAMTDDVTDEQFDAAIEGAKAEGNLSRANVVRKVRGEAGKVPVSQQLDRIEELAGEGWHSTQIAKELGTSSDNIRTLARKAGIKITADDVLRGAQHHIDMTRYARETVAAIENAATGLALLDYADIDIDEATRQEWVATLDDSLRALNRFRKHIKEMTTHA